MVTPTLRLPVRATLLFLGGLLLLQGAWILAVPPFDGTDEIAHVYRALTLADGDLRPAVRPLKRTEGLGDLVAVRGDVVRAAAPACETFRPSIGPANCRPVGTEGRDRVLIGSTAAAYDPAGYLAPALASRLADGTDTVYAMRIAAALVCALVLSAVFWTLARRSRTRWPALFWLLALTPTTVFLTTVAAPTGLQLVSGLGLWAVLGLAFLGQDGPVHRPAGLLAGAAALGVLLATTHTLGVVWLPLVLASAALAAGRTRLRERYRAAPRAHLVAGLALVVGWLASIGWILTAGTNDVSRVVETAPGSPFPRVFLGVVLWPLQALAVFPSRDEPAPVALYAVWMVALGLLLGVALASAGRRARRTSGLVFAIATLAAMLLTVLTYDQIGLAWQGRYGYPYLVGALVVLGVALDRRRVRAPAWFQAPVCVALLVLAGVIGIGGVIAAKHRLAVWRDLPHWPTPSVAVLVVVGLLVAACWTAAVLSVDAECADTADR